MKNRLREILEERGIKQVWLADKVGVRKAHINLGKTYERLRAKALTAGNVSWWSLVQKYGG